MNFGNLLKEIVPSAASSVNPALGLGLSLGTSLFSNTMNRSNATASAQQQYDYTLALQKQNQDWQEYMSSTSHQREVKDLLAAGLNPILSANSGSSFGSGTGPTVGGQQASPIDVGSGILSFASAVNQYRQLELSGYNRVFDYINKLSKSNNISPKVKNYITDVKGEIVNNTLPLLIGNVKEGTANSRAISYLQKNLIGGLRRFAPQIWAGARFAGKMLGFKATTPKSGLSPTEIDNFDRYIRTKYNVK